MVVGSQRDRKSCLEVAPQWVRGEARRSPRLHVARDTRLHSNAMIGHVGHERRIVPQMRPVADAMRAAAVDGVPNRIRAGGLTRVTSTGDIMLASVEKRGGMRRSRVPRFGARKVEPHDSGGSMSDGKPRGLERSFRAQLA